MVSPSKSDMELEINDGFGDLDRWGTLRNPDLSQAILFTDNPNIIEKQVLQLILC